MSRQLKLVPLVVSLSIVAFAQSQRCEFNQYLVPGGSSYRIDSNGEYARGSQCIWRSFTDKGSIIELNCPEFDLPVNGNVCLDQFIVSDNQNGQNGIAYCGRQKLYHVTKGSNLFVQIIADQRPARGRFSCTVRALKSTPPINQCRCGYSFKSRIVGGKETGINEFPMMAALVSNQMRELFCGATLVTQRHSITAAHCVKGRNPNDLGLLVGDHDITTGRETNSSQLVRVSRVYSHPNFVEADLKNDIGIAEVYDKIRFTARVGPACLPFRRPEYPNSRTVQALGWGTTGFGGVRSNTLQKAALKVIPISSCQATYKSKINPSGQICTYEPKVDACQYDSGGPILIEDSVSNSLMLLGIISYGRGCAFGDPGVNTWVYPYLNWIQPIISSEFYCIVN